MVSMLFEARRFSLGVYSRCLRLGSRNPALEDTKFVEIHEGREIRSSR